MSIRGRWVLAAGLLLCGWLTAQVCPRLLADQQDQKAADKKEEKEDIQVQVAKAYVKVVEAEYNKYAETNRKLPGTIRPQVMQALQTAIREAQDRVKLAQNDDMSDGEIYIASAKADLLDAEEALRKANAANLQFADTVGPSEVARLKAVIDLAKLKVQMADKLSSDTPLSRVSWELEQLREEVQELRLIVALLRDRN